MSGIPSNAPEALIARMGGDGGWENLDQVFDEVKRTFEVDHVVYHGVNVRGLTEDGPYLRLTYSDAWVAQYRERNYLNVDPVIEEGRRAFWPFNWTMLDWSGLRRQAFAEDARRHGVGLSGMTVPIRGPEGQHALFSVSTMRSADEWDEQVERQMRDLHLLGHTMHNTVLRLEGVEASPASPLLSGREKNVLQLSAAGKTTAQVASSLEIAERTVRVYLDTARHKLGATNRTHAVAKALSLGLIPPPE